MASIQNNNSEQNGDENASHQNGNNEQNGHAMASNQNGNNEQNGHAMASNQNGNNEQNGHAMTSNQNGNSEPNGHSMDLNQNSNSDSDEYEIDFTSNGNSESPPQLDENVDKIVVIGEPRCGKTRFIRAYYNHHFPGDCYSHNGVTVYPCEFEADNGLKRVAIFEIPGDPDFFEELRVPHYEEADIIVFMYAIDDPRSIQMLYDKWIIETIEYILQFTIPVVFVGTKKDLENDPQVNERLALQNQTPVTFEEGRQLLDMVPNYRAIVECSANDLEQINVAFDTIFSLLLLINEI